MRRRAFLIGAGALVSVSGCVSGVSDTEDPHEEVTVDDGKIEVAFNELYARDDIDYYDPETDTVEGLGPENGLWAQALLIIDYNGGGEIPTDSVDNLTAETGGSVYHPVDDLSVDEDHLRDDRFRHPSFWRRKYGETMDSRVKTLFGFIFDVPDSDLDFYWEYDGTKYLMAPLIQNLS